MILYFREFLAQLVFRGSAGPGLNHVVRFGLCESLTEPKRKYLFGKFEESVIESRGCGFDQRSRLKS